MLGAQVNREAVEELETRPILDAVGAVIIDNVDLVRSALHAQHLVLGSLHQQTEKASEKPFHHILVVSREADQSRWSGCVERVQQLDHRAKHKTCFWWSGDRTREFRRGAGQEDDRQSRRTRAS